MISLEDALERMLPAIQPLGCETIKVGAAAGRFLAADVASAIDLPPFDNSAMDGYAVRSDDLKTASAERPLTLRLSGRVAAGEQFSGALLTGECVRLFTGSPLPRGADAVVMQEDVSATGEGLRRFTEPVRPFENVRLRGEDLKAGVRIAQKGDRANAALAGVLAACGVSDLWMARQPVVALLATGSELREPGSPLRPGEIYESNRALLAPLLAGAGCQVLSFPLLGDDLPKTIHALEHAFNSADAVITTGGVSVGEFDFVKEAFTRIGGSIDLWRVAIRPGNFV